jgi:hypothetical protein
MSSPSSRGQAAATPRTGRRNCHATGGPSDAPHHTPFPTGRRRASRVADLAAERPSSGVRRVVHGGGRDALPQCHRLRPRDASVGPAARVLRLVVRIAVVGRTEPVLVSRLGAPTRPVGTVDLVAGEGWLGLRRTLGPNRNGSRRCACRDRRLTRPSAGLRAGKEPTVADNIELIMRFHPVGGEDVSLISADFGGEAEALETIARARRTAQPGFDPRAIQPRDRRDRYGDQPRQRGVRAGVEDRQRSIRPVSVTAGSMGIRTGQRI